MTNFSIKKIFISEENKFYRIGYWTWVPRSKKVRNTALIWFLYEYVKHFMWYFVRDNFELFLLIKLFKGCQVK